MARMYGLTRPEELIGRSGSEILHPDDLDKTRQEMRLARQERYAWGSGQWEARCGYS